MKKYTMLFLIVFSFFGQAFSQKVIDLSSIPTPPGIVWNTPERQYHSQIWNTEVVTNVSKPTLTVYLPDPSVANGTALVIAPGGGYMALSINSEGAGVADWCVAHGITAFVLKYRIPNEKASLTLEAICNCSTGANPMPRSAHATSVVIRRVVASMIFPSRAAMTANSVPAGSICMTRIKADNG